MFERETVVYAYLLGYARSLAADIDDARMTEQPSPGVNHPAWLLGHLALSTDFALMMLGRPGVLPKRWHVLFGPGSLPKEDRSHYPPKAELLQALADGHARVTEALKAADPKALAEPHGLDLSDFRETLPTKADLLQHLLTSHGGMHLGHLSNWRRQVGLPFLF